MFSASWWPFGANRGSTTVQVNTNEKTNQGIPFYIFFKEVEKGEFLKHEYQQVVVEAFPFSNKSPDLEPRIIFPGRNYEFQLSRNQKEKPLGVYVFYTNPGNDWKFLATASGRINLDLGDSEILKAQMR